jgi:hypothetical protein
VKLRVLPVDEAVVDVGERLIVPVPSMERVTNPFVPLPALAAPPALPALAVTLVALLVVSAKFEPPPPPPAGLCPLSTPPPPPPPP